MPQDSVMQIVLVDYNEKNFNSKLFHASKANNAQNISDISTICQIYQILS